MFLVNYDIDHVLISYILYGTERWNFNMIKRLYIIFGRSQFKSFIMSAKKYYFNQLFLTYSVNTLDDLFKKMLNINNPHFYKEHIEFRKNPNLKYNNFEGLRRKQYVMVRYLALYNDYIWICTKREKYEHLGYVYSKIHDNLEYKNKPLKYSFLKLKRIHNLDYYNLVDKADNIYDSTFILKQDAHTHKLGATIERCNIDCIKI